MRWWPHLRPVENDAADDHGDALKMRDAAARPHGAEALGSPARPQQDTPLVRPDARGASQRQGRAQGPARPHGLRREVGRDAIRQGEDRHGGVVGAWPAIGGARVEGGSPRGCSARRLTQRFVARGRGVPALREGLALHRSVNGVELGGNLLAGPFSEHDLGIASLTLHGACTKFGSADRDAFAARLVRARDVDRGSH